MQTVLQLIKDYPFLCAGLVVLIALTVFMTVKASKAAKRTNANKEALMKKLDHLKMLRENYSDITEESIKNDSGENLLEGVASNIQLGIEKESDLTEAFMMLNDEKKMIYALNYFLDESKEGVSSFFKNYQEPLTPIALTACEKFTDEYVYSRVKTLYDMYDSDNEEVSFFPDEIKKIDEELASHLDIDKIKLDAAGYIKKNCEKFV